AERPQVGPERVGEGDTGFTSSGHRVVGCAPAQAPGEARRARAASGRAPAAWRAWRAARATARGNVLAVVHPSRVSNGGVSNPTRNVTAHPYHVRIATTL